jgi:phosphomannomutase
MTLSAPEVFHAVGIETIPVFCKPDPLFQDRPSDPKPEHLSMLKQTVVAQHCDFGVAFDGDGDRSIIVDNKGRVLSSDETGILLGKYGLGEQKGTVIVNVEVSKAVQEQLEPLGFTIKQIQVGHTFLTLEAKKEQSPLGIESSGHLILPEFFLFDDALVVPLKIAQILDGTKNTIGELADEIPTYPTKKVEIPCPDAIKFQVVNQLKQDLSKEYPEINALDGVRVTLDQGWVLVRPSNTSPLIRLTVEGDTTQVVERYAQAFTKQTKALVEQANHT